MIASSTDPFALLPRRRAKCANPGSHIIEEGCDARYCRARVGDPL